MKVYRLLAAVLLLFILAGVVSAAGDVNDTVETAANEDTLHSGVNYTFRDLNTAVNSSCDVLEIEHDYTFNNDTDTGFDEGVIINRSNYLISGNNHVIDAKGKVSVFKITGNNITITNLVLKNTIDYTVEITGDGIVTRNVTFIGCAGTDIPRAVHVIYSTYTSNGDTFIDCAAGGRAIYTSYSNLTVNNSAFINTTGIEWGIIRGYESVINIYNTTFANCSSNYATAFYGTFCQVNIK